jgi:class 3 adenylate cyclase/predicted ATPase
MNVGTWLRELGLAQHEAAFREQQIEADVLPELTDRHLRELGLSFAHRLILLRAIRELEEELPPSAPSKAAETEPRDGAERRQLTVMFCDLVGLSALTAVSDPEDMAELIRASQGAITSAVARFDGHVARSVGDGATLYFGYPRAHEDDAERAVRAGLALVVAIDTLARERDVPIEARAGISTGLVVVGEVIGEGEARERGVVGDTPNLAARLRNLAAPGTIMVSDYTRRLLGRSFELKALGPQPIKGFTSDVQAWRILRERKDVTRFEASRSGALTPFVGRELEMAALMAHWRAAVNGQGQVVILSGEAGIGKSRMVAGLRERIRKEPHLVLRFQCSPHHINDAFFPVIGQTWRDAGLVSGEPAAARLDKLEKVSEGAGLDPQTIVPYLASLLGIPASGRYALVDIEPRELKERTGSALMALMIALARQAPLLILLEDAHWIDPSTLDLTHQTVANTCDLPILLVVTHRPEFMPPWDGPGHVTRLSLNRFDEAEAAAMVESMVGGRKLPSEVRDQIVEKTDGVPLFLEELTKSVLESGLLREEKGVYVLAAALTPLAIPSTLHDSLMARLDRLSPVKEIAQIGAAIGREFSHDLLAAVAPIKGEALDNALRQLIDAELIRREGTPPNLTYAFKHALVQDAAYGSLLRSRRQRIHADIAQALAQGSAEICPPAIIARHFTEAGLYASAAPAWLSAAELALLQSAPVEAERHAGAGLALIPRIEAGSARDALELALLVARANALVPLKSISAPETFAALAAAKELLDRGVGTDLQRVSILYGLCSGSALHAKLSQALDFARGIIEVAERRDDAASRVVGYRQLGTIQLFTGDNRAALASLRKGEQYCPAGWQKALSFRFGWDQRLAMLAFEVLARLSLGLLDSAAGIAARVQEEAAQHGHATTMASATFCSRTWPKLVLGDLADLEADCAGLVTYCAEKKVEQIRLLAILLCAYARSMRAPVDTNIAALRIAFAELQKSGGHAGSSMFFCCLAEASIAAGDLASASQALQDGFAFVKRSGERYWLADLHRLNGRLALGRRMPDRVLAESCFTTAIQVARGQEARLLELRAANDLTQLWRDLQSDQDAHALLQPILDAIEGGETAPDVRTARSFLEAHA